MLKMYPLIKVYYDEAGHLIFVYAPLWAVGFLSEGDLNELDKIGSIFALSTKGAPVDD